MTYDTMNNDVTIVGSAEGALLANRYRIVKQLGQGGMGSVWLAEDTQLDNKQFAIKMLPSILVSNKRAYRQLKDEALVAMQLVHPNIVQIRAFEENNGNPFLVMDYIDGQTLDDYLAEKGMLSEDETIRLLKPIADALDYAHGEGVVHRDVKPANIMIRKDGHPFILDFGIAREIQETMTRVTGKLSSGTLLYMSPEQLRGQPPKAAQDVYSFAAMAYECLKGEPPFSRGQIEYQILNEQPERLSNDIRMSAAIMRGLSKTQESRPDSCVKVLLAAPSIRRMPPARPQVAVPPRSTAPMTDRIVVRPKRNIVGIVLPLFCLVAALLVLGGVLWHREAQRQETARKLAVEQEELRRRQAENERKAQEESSRKKAAAERLEKQQQEEAQRKAEEDAKRSEAEKKAKEHELARQREEEARKAAEAEKAAIAARKKADADKAMALQSGIRSLELLAIDPLQYESVSMDLTRDQRNLLSPLYDEVVRGEAYLNELLEKYTELNPKVVGTRKEQNFRVANFKSVVKTLQNGSQPSDSLASPTERFDDYLVKTGDSLAKIAISHGTSIVALKELNGLDGYQLRVGQSLKVPIKATIAKPKVNDGKKLLIKDSGTAFLRDAIMPFVQNGSLPGAIGVLYKNGCQETACMGWANVDKHIPMSMDRTFMISSQSKGFCGVCVALLVEEGKINLDDPVSRYLPQFANMMVEIKDGNSIKSRVVAQDKMSIRHLLTHCAGFPFDVPSTEKKGWTSCPISQVVAEAAANPLIAEPGTKTQYSNVGFAIAAAIIEKLSGRRYEEFLEERIFNPLGMRDTTFNPTDEQLSRRVSMYTLSQNAAPVYTPENKWMPLPHNGPTVHAYPAMGLWSTANDLLKFYQMIMLKGVGANGVRLLQEQTVLELLATSQRPSNLQGYYSLGFSILQDEPGWLGHGGAWGTYFKVNIVKQELFLWVVQLCGGPRPWDVQRKDAAKSFFRNVP